MAVKLWMQVVVVSNGRAEEQGTHQELLALQGLYAMMSIGGVLTVARYARLVARQLQGDSADIQEENVPEPVAASASLEPT